MEYYYKILCVTLAALVTLLVADEIVTRWIRNYQMERPHIRPIYHVPLHFKSTDIDFIQKAVSEL